MANCGWLGFVSDGTEGLLRADRDSWAQCHYSDSISVSLPGHCAYHSSQITAPTRELKAATLQSGVVRFYVRSVSSSSSFLLPTVNSRYNMRQILQRRTSDINLRCRLQYRYQITSDINLRYQLQYRLQIKSSSRPSHYTLQLELQTPPSIPPVVPPPLYLTAGAPDSPLGPSSRPSPSIPDSWSSRLPPVSFQSSPPIYT